MKRCLTAVTLLLLLTVTITAFISCSGDTPVADRNKYSVTFLSEDTVFHSEDVYDGDTVSIPSEEPIKEGYTFRGWYSNGTEYDFSSRVRGNLTLQAYFTDSSKAQVRVIYYEGRESLTYVTCGEEYTLPSSQSRNGYIFKGWKVNEDEALRNPEETLSIASDTVITADYTPLTVSVTFLDKDGNEIEGAKYENIPWGTVVTPPETKADAGKIIKHWRDSDDNVITMGSSPFTAEKDFTLHPIFENGKCYVTYDYGTGKVTKDVEYGSKAGECRVFRSGFELDYWYKDNEQEEFSFENSPITSDITLHAKWKEIEGDTVTLTLLSGPEHHEFNEVITLKKGSKYDMCFMDGTFVLPDTDGEEYKITSWTGDDGSVINNDRLQITVDKDLTLTAVWEKKRYKVQFNLRDGKYTDADGNEKTEIDSVEVDINSIVKDPGVKLTKDGYEFEGWSLDGKNVYDFSTPVMKDISLRALWKDPDYRLTLKYCDGKTSDSVRLYPEGTELGAISIETPSRSGYTFEGWYYSETEDVKIDESYAITKDLTIYAHWEKTDVYTVSYYDALGSTLLYSETVNVGDKAMGYSAPKIKGTQFIGWYEDTDGTISAFMNESFDFTEPVDRNVKLRVRYTADENYFSGNWKYSTYYSLVFENKNISLRILGNEYTSSATGKWDYSSEKLTVSLSGRAALDMGGMITGISLYPLSGNGTRTMDYTFYNEQNGFIDTAKYTLYLASSTPYTWEGGHGRWSDSVTITESSFKDMRKYVINDTTQAEITVTMKNEDGSDAECVLNSSLIVPVSSDTLIIAGLFGGYWDEVVLTRVK